MGSPTQHSRLFPPSSAKRWMSCAASAVLCAVAPREPDSPESIEGTLAHAVGEKTIKHWMRYHNGEYEGDYPTTQYHYGDTLKNIRVDEMMVKHTQGYVDNITRDILEPGAVSHIEHRIDFSAAIGVPHGSAFGTSDATIYLPEQKLLKVKDFKYGKWPIEPEHNPQAMLYALAAMWKYQYLYDFRLVEITIYQPRLNGEPLPDKSWTTTAESIWAFSRFAYGRAKKVQEADNHYRKHGTIPIEYFKQSDENCQFCRAVKCEARARSIFKK